MGTYITAQPRHTHLRHHNKRDNVDLVMPRDPFKPLSPRKSIVSGHPKSISDRKYSHAKSGLALARRRCMSAYRTSKSRRLKALRTGGKWETLSDDQRREAEAEIIAALDAQLAEKMEAHTLQWRLLVENGEVSDNDDDEGVIFVDSSAEGEEVGEGEEGGDDSDHGDVGWLTDSEEGGNDENLSRQLNVSETAIMEFKKIREVAGKAWLEKMKRFEDKAQEEERKWCDMVDE